jgi:sortase A
MRRAARTLGTLLIVAGVATLAWAALVWQWQDPFTYGYTSWQQRSLSRDYEERLTRFTASPPPAGASLAAQKRRVAADAKRYRKSLDRGDAIGRLRVPRLGLNMIFVNGTDHDTLTRGPGRYLGSYLPGEGRLVYIAGHRTTYSAPFSDIDRLRRGDRVTLELPYGTFEYRVTGHRIVAATRLDVLKPGKWERIALQACHPRFFASHRYIVYAERADARAATGAKVQAAAPAGAQSSGR